MILRILATPIKSFLDKAMLMVMGAKADEDGKIVMSVSDWTDLTGMDRKTITACIGRLRDGGWLIDTGERQGATRSVPVYAIKSGIIASDSIKIGRTTNRPKLTDRREATPNTGQLSVVEIGAASGEANPDTGQLTPSRSTENLSFLPKESKNLYILPTSVPTENPIQTTDTRETKTADLLFIHPPQPVSSNAVGVTNAVGPKAKRGPRRLPDHPVPEDWQPDAAGIAFAKKSGVDVDDQVPIFRDWYASRGLLRASWSATWRTWCRKQKEWREEAEAKARPAVGAPYVMSTLRTNL